MERLYKIVLVLILFASHANGAEEYKDYNQKVMDTVDWIAKNKAGLGYDKVARYTEDLNYGDYVFRSTGGTKTMCVAAVFEILIRTLADAKTKNGDLVAKKLLVGKVLSGSKALNVAPYVFQYESAVKFPEYDRKYSAGIGDAFVLFGIGRYVTFESAKPGDFVYLNRVSGNGHATVFISFLDEAGKPAGTSKNAIGFRYFSAQEGGTHGMGYRDAVFGKCRALKTEYVQDCNVIKSESRRMFSVSRLYDPDYWFTSYSAIRIERFFKGETIDKIYEEESAFRARAKSEQDEAEKKAKQYASKGLFPMITTPIAGESKSAEMKVKNFAFDDEKFGPNFEDD